MMQIDFEALVKRAEEVLAFRDGLLRQTPRFPDDQCAVVLQTTGEHYMKGFTIDDGNRFAYENIRRWADGTPFRCTDPMTGREIDGDIKRGLYICGPTGSGKSALVDIIRFYCKILNYKTRYNGQDEVLAWTPKRADVICNEFLATGDLAPYIEPRILCIDDAGTEPTETLYMGNRVQVIKSILEARADMPSKMTIVTSNYKVAEEHYGDRVASRLCNMCNYFELIHTDWRKANHNNTPTK